MQRKVDWLNPYIQRVRELAELTPPHIDKHTQALTFHSSYIEQQQQATTSGGAATGALSANKTIVNSILIKLLSIYKTILKHNLPVDQPIIDVSFLCHNNPYIYSVIGIIFDSVDQNRKFSRVCR